MSVAVATQISSVARSLSLSDAGLARIVCASPSSVRRWLKGDSTPRSISRQRLFELTAVSELLAKVMKPDAAAEWLQTPNSLLEGVSPAARIAEGDYLDVLGLVQALGEGIVV